ncbi:hypothetical protein HMPREF0290_1625, partial [Corynebacterium efficiens YS-314]
AGRIAATRATAPGSYAVALIDALHQLDRNQLANLTHLREENR